MMYANIGLKSGNVLYGKFNVEAPKDMDDSRAKGKMMMDICVEEDGTMFVPLRGDHGTATVHLSEIEFIQVFLGDMPDE